MSTLRKLALQLLSLYLGLFAGGLAKSAAPAANIEPAKPDGARWSADHRGAPSPIETGLTQRVPALTEPANRPVTETAARLEETPLGAMRLGAMRLGVMPSCPVARSMLSMLAGRDADEVVEIIKQRFRTKV